MTKRSAGLLLYRRREGRLEVLIAHMGGPFWQSKEKGAWTIPKGLIDEDEEALAAARREFEEELGISPPEGPAIDLGEIRQSSGKRVHVWAVEGDFDPSTLRSNTFEIEWPPRSGKREHFPEIDRAEWFRPDEIEDRIVKGQDAFIERLVTTLEGSARDREDAPSETTRSTPRARREEE